MLNSEEEGILSKILEKDENSNLKTQNNTKPIFLSGILYFSPNQWTIWLNGNAVSADTVPQDITIKSVESGAVTLCINDGDASTVILRPNQTLLPIDRQVVNGDQRFLKEQDNLDLNNQASYDSAEHYKNKQKL